MQINARGRDLFHFCKTVRFNKISCIFYWIKVWRFIPLFERKNAKKYIKKIISVNLATRLRERVRLRAQSFFELFSSKAQLIAFAHSAETWAFSQCRKMEADWNCSVNTISPFMMKKITKNFSKLPKLPKSQKRQKWQKLCKRQK